ncbi:carboxymuconolactone decarboxylase family protein [Planomicrobium sp. Y74]|uniref:carboxymuconolactone decarboxylase family protein n=1 Tax=Planomicrobium sp. Y74 TaxID=2478977 RepID=UPI000EF46ECB|nr:carboxymuconolactone decarboxylase family protein [Planomicrobium sp. Y74]RLQ84855.1 carboxymuconolactone decarboxylase family protein [Planomicrobium sp. Y74]
MTRINPSPYGKTVFQKLLGHNVKVMNSWSELGDILERDGLLSAQLKEQVRRTLAQSNGCAYCKAKGKPDPHHFDEKTSVSVGFAEVFLSYPQGMVPDFAFDILMEYFSEKEISELCAFISFTVAQQYFGAVMKLEATCSKELSIAPPPFD